MQAEAAKVVALLGQGLRSRALVAGREACRRALQRGRVAAIVLARDAGASAARDIGWRPPVPLLQVGLDKRDLGAALGRGDVAVVGITEPHLAAGLAPFARAVRPGDAGHAVEGRGPGR